MAAPAVDGGEEEDIPDKGPYVLPPVSLLDPLSCSKADHGDTEAICEKLLNTLKLFDIEASLAYKVQGPVVTQYALSLAPGTKPEKVESLQNTLMMATMQAKTRSSIRAIVFMEANTCES